VRDASAEATDQTSAGPAPEDDTALINAVRSGDADAYGVLYERHVVAAKRAASAARHADRDDLVAESFTQVLRVLRAGRGPDEKLRPYLLTTVRNAVTDSYRRDSAQSVVAEVPDTPPPDGRDPADARMHAMVAATAFRRLPHRWRCVLWYTEVEQRSPAEVAELLGLKPNGVAALAYRAREALRQAYLDQYLPTASPRQCRPVVEQLAKWVRHKSPVSARKRISAHISECGCCRGLATDLERLNQQLPLLLGPLVAGAPFAIAGMAGTAGTLVAAAGVAETAATGLSIASWAAAAKTVLAGAAVVATTSLGAADSPATGPGSSAGATQPAPREHHVAAPRSPVTYPGQHHAPAEAGDGHDARPTTTRQEKTQADKAAQKKDKKAAKAKKAQKEKGAKKQKKPKKPKTRDK
jgi:RNA polymerase sigma factor (sigma-70 family)